MKQLICLLLGVATLVLVQSCESNRRANNYNNKALVDDNGLQFIKTGMEGSLVSVKASGFALSNSKNQQVIQFAKMIIDSHTQLSNNFKQLEADNFVTEADSINPIHQQEISELEKKHATVFDKAYMAMMINDHTDELAFYKAATQNKSPSIADFAKKTIPSLKAHLDSAKMINASLK